MHLGRLHEDDPSLIEDTPPHRGRYDGLMATVEDLHPELILQLLYHRAEGRLRDLTGVGRLTEVAVLI